MRLSRNAAVAGLGRLPRVCRVPVMDALPEFGRTQPTAEAVDPGVSVASRETGAMGVDKVAPGAWNDRRNARATGV